jgi:hypothetical protein
MSSKKNKAMTGGEVLALKIGSRVRCTDDGVLGKIAWANATSVKIKWDDGEEVNWKRAELTAKPIEFLDAKPAVEAPAPEVNESSVATEPPEAPEPEVMPEVVAETTPITPEVMLQETAAATVLETTPVGEQPTIPPDATTPEQPAPVSERPNAETPAEPNRKRKTKTLAGPKAKKVSALDAAAKVLADASTMLTCKEMIAAMASKGYWTSPGGQTPDATLCSAILREIKVKGDQSRFVKAAPGRFTARPTA